MKLSEIPYTPVLSLTHRLDSHISVLPGCPGPKPATDLKTFSKPEL